MPVNETCVVVMTESRLIIEDLSHVECFQTVNAVECDVCVVVMTKSRCHQRLESYTIDFFFLN